MKLCIPITASSNAEARKKIQQGLALAPILELRIDGIPHPDLKGFLSRRKGEILVTNRMREEGGRFSGSERERVDLLKKAVALGCNYVDLELRTSRELRSQLKNEIAAHKGRTRLILSYHNLTKTPGIQGLRKKLEEGQKAGADIVKIVPLARGMEDNLKVLSLIPMARKQGMVIIAFCMGALGKISRVMAPLLGSYLTYVSLSKGQESAPGQLTVGEMKRITQILKAS
ncbi:MAG: type I 3-dehydroquinate dehydratase [Thermodesulfobacteriota bacterium]